MMNDDLNSNKVFTEVFEQYYKRGSIYSVYIKSFIQSNMSDALKSVMIC